MKILIGFSLAVCALAQVGRPQIGKMLDARGAGRSVYGIASSVTLGDIEATGVISSGCGKTFCLMKTATSVISATGSVNAPAGPALFAFNGAQAFLWFRQTGQLVQWQNDSLTPVSSTISGGVLSIEAHSGSVIFAVRTSNGVSIIGSDGGVLEILPPETGPVQLIPGGAVYATRDEIVVREVRIPLEGVTGFSRMSDGYVEVRTHGANYALRTEKGSESLFQLPGVAQ